MASVLLAILFLAPLSATLDPKSTEPVNSATTVSSNPEQLTPAPGTCVLACGMQSAPAWKSVLDTPLLVHPFSIDQMQKTISTNGLNKAEALRAILQKAANMTDEVRVETFEKVCSVFKSYRDCLKKCPEDVIRELIESGSATLQMLCGEKHSDYVEALPCLASHERTMRTTCNLQNKALSSVGLELQHIFNNNPEKRLAILRKFCGASMNQSLCTLPAVENSCGQRAAELMKSVMEHSLEVSKKVLTRSGIDLPSECDTARLTPPTFLRGRDMQTLTDNEIQTQIPAPQIERGSASSSAIDCAICLILPIFCFYVLTVMTSWVFVP